MILRLRGDALFWGLLWLFGFMSKDFPQPQGPSFIAEGMETQVCMARCTLRFEAIGVRVGRSVTQ